MSSSIRSSAGCVLVWGRTLSTSELFGRLAADAFVHGDARGNVSTTLLDSLVCYMNDSL
jgi:hypothetical protein